jgi:hypothetical protein
LFTKRKMCRLPAGGWVGGFVTIRRGRVGDQPDVLLLWFGAAARADFPVLPGQSQGIGSPCELDKSA